MCMSEHAKINQNNWEVKENRLSWSSINIFFACQSILSAFEILKKCLFTYGVLCSCDRVECVGYHWPTSLSLAKFPNWPLETFSNVWFICLWWRTRMLSIHSIHFWFIATFFYFKSHAASIDLLLLTFGDVKMEHREIIFALYKVSKYYKF